MKSTIHVVCLDCPSPPDYGGAIDMFYTIKSLSERGDEVILHYFAYRPSRTTTAIEPFCKAVYSYKRKRFWESRPLSRPFIVQSRIHHELTERLNADDYPILLEGLHCSGIIPYINNSDRIVLRMHNDEVSYYRNLAKAEPSFWKRLYFLRETALLFSYQKRMPKKVQLACLSESDEQIFKTDYGFQQTAFVPCFLSWQTVAGREGSGSYCLYHGNLSVAENEEAALWLIEAVFNSLTIPFVIAGNGASKKLLTAVKKYPHLRLVNNPPMDELNALVLDAHIHVLPSFNSTGVKLKLLHALLHGRYCITNEQGIMGSGLKKGVVVCSTEAGWKEAVQSLMQKEFLEKDKKDRQESLSLYDNQANAEKLSGLWSRYQ